MSQFSFLYMTQDSSASLNFINDYLLIMIIDWNWLNTLKPGKKFFVFVIDDLRDFALWTLFIKCCLKETVQQISRMITIRISSVPQINVSTISIDSVQSSWQNFPGTFHSKTERLTVLRIGGSHDDGICPNVVDH